MAKRTDAPTPLAHVIGKNARDLRGDVPGARLAVAARKRGLNWGTGRIADLEAGRVSPTLSTLIAVALALGDIRGKPIRLSDLVKWDGFVSVTGDLTLTGEALARYVSGRPVEAVLAYIPGGREKVDKLLSYLDRASSHFEGVDPDLSSQVFQRSGEAEERAAEALGIDLGEMSAASAYLWGRSLSDERDARAGAKASPQKRGRITRELRHELLMALSGKRRASDGD